MTAAALPPAVVTGVGSLPHTDPARAVEAVLAFTPDLPAAPQLPARHPAESILGQVVSSIPSVRLDGTDGTLRIIGPLDPEAVNEVSMAGDAFVGTRALLDAAGAGSGPVKVQVVGPLTLAAALVDAGASVDAAVGVATVAVRRTVGALVAEVAVRCPGRSVLAVLDEPSLVALGSTSFPIDPVAAVDVLSAALAGAGRAAATGVHCCGRADWALVLSAGMDVLSVPVDVVDPDDAGTIAGFLEAGGYVAWGAVPTDRPIGESADILWRRLVGLWCDLTRGGCDPMRIRQQSLITPACGLANHGITQAERVLRLAGAVARRVRDQSAAARLVVGA